MTVYSRAKQLAFYRYNRTMMRWSNVLFRGILRTPPVEANACARLVLFTLLDQNNVCAYLLALKSFLRFVHDLQFRIVVQDDGTLTPKSVATLTSHVKGIEVHSRASADALVREKLPEQLRSVFPTFNGCSPLLATKLFNVLYRLPNEYVIHFDSDLLFLRPPSEVFECLTNRPGRAFHTGGRSGRLTERLPAIGLEFPYVRLTRFNSGFAGFQNSFTDAEVTSVIDAINKADPALFAEWEIEQAVWCKLFNYCPDPLDIGLLREGYVGNGWRSYESLRDQAVLIHFIGATRFRNAMYVRLARRVIRELRS